MSSASSKVTTACRRYQFVVLLLLTCGCQKGPELGIVEGLLIIQGKPSDKVRVEFIPEVGANAPNARGETDENGRFTLHLMDRSGAPPEGATVGEYRVTLSDLHRAEFASGEGVPVRFGSEYTKPSETPLRQTVVAGPQQITIEIP